MAHGDWSDGLFASCYRWSNCSLTRAMDGRISAIAPLALADQLSLPMIVKRGWSVRFPCNKTRSVALASFADDGRNVCMNDIVQALLNVHNEKYKVELSYCCCLAKSCELNDCPA